MDFLTHHMLRSSAIRFPDKEALVHAQQRLTYADTCVAIEKDVAAILYTSGSTGKPKGVMLSHANVMAGASIVSDYLNISPTDRILAALPFSFDAGLNQLTTAMQQGSTLVLIKFLFAREIVHMLETEKITGLAGVPPLWSLLSQPSSQLHQKRPSALRYITNTGGALPQHVLASLRQALPETQVFLMYGLTEAFRSTYLPPDELDRRPGSMGKAIPNTEIMLINEHGQRCGPGEIGELVHHGPTVSMGYWGQPELTNKVLRPHPFPTDGISPGERVCYSGDLVKDENMCSRGPKLKEDERPRPERPGTVRSEPSDEDLPARSTRKAIEDAP
jgi:acyl-CoA synthetase (AMP-forming)/AMP-acid ligase II